jgi:type VI secretion system secreted protein VgrG
MNPLELFGRHRNLAISSSAIPQVIEGIQSLEVIRIEGSESLDIGTSPIFEYKVLLKTPAELSHIPAQVLLGSFDLGAMIGKLATLHIALDDIRVAGMDNVREITGVIATAQFKRVAERALHFEFTIRDWLWLGTLNKDSAIHQNKTVVDTLKDTLNATYPYMFDLRLNKSYPIRDYCVRMGENADEFIKRLCQEYSINLHYEHKNGSARLILSDDNNAFKPFPSPAFQTLRYHGDSDFIDEEHWHTLSPSRNLTTGAVTYRDYNYVAPDATNEVGRNEPRRNRANEQINNGHFEQYHYHTNAFTNIVQPRAGTEDENDPLTEGEVFTLDHLQSLQQHDERVSAIGNIRVAVVGYSFKLINHPITQANTDYIVVAAHLLIEEVASETQRINEAQEWKVQTSATLQPLNIPLKPNKTLTKPRVEGVEIARVVGYKGDLSIWTDDLGRIRIAMPWHRDDPMDETSTCWVRVASNAAGNQQGSLHLPRINDEVLISYIGGDPDLPVCTGIVYNATHMPPWVLPKNQALSGYRSRELKPGNQSDGRSNHLILDDSEDAIQAQLKSDESHSSISLGHITRVQDSGGRKDKRGTGFEARTDGHGAIRAAKGILITTQSRSAAANHITDLDEAASELKQAHNQHKSTAQQASEHKAFNETDDAKMLDETIKAQNGEVTGQQPANPSKGEFPELTAPHMVIHSVAGTELTTLQSTHIHSGEHMAFTTGQHLSMSVGKRLLASAMQGIRLFAQSAGIKMFAAKGKVEIQAQSDHIEIIADQILKIISAKKTIEIAAAEEILLTAEGSYTKINGQGIEHGTPKAFTVYSATKSFVGPKSLPYALPKDPYDNMFVLIDKETGNPVPDFAYKVKTADGAVYQGLTNELGEALRIGTSHQSKVLKIERGGE